MSAITHHDLWTSDVTPTPSRRRCERQHLTWALVYVELGPDNGGIVLNISNDGFSIQAAMPLIDDGTLEMRLKGGRDSDWTEVSGRIAWMSDTQTVAGIQFVDLSDESRQRISEWIALEASPPPPERRPARSAAATKPINPVVAPKPRLIIEPPTTALPVPHLEFAPSLLPGALAPLADRRIVSWQIVLLAVLTFAAGLLLGHGVLGRSSGDPSKLAARMNDLPAATTSLPAKIDNQSSAIAAPGGQPASTPQSMGALDNRTTSSDVRGLATQTQSPQSESKTPRGTADAPATRGNSSAESASIASDRPDSENRAATMQQSVNAPPSPGSVVTQPANASSPPVVPAASPATETAHSASTPSSGEVAEASVSFSAPKADARAPEANVSVTQSSEMGTQLAQSPGPIDPCRLIRSVQPIYPQEAKRQHVEGNVQLRVVVGTDGAVQSVGLVDGPPVFVPAAMTAARQFRYSPALLKGRPIETIQTIDMSFRLKH